MKMEFGRIGAGKWIASLAVATLGLEACTTVPVTGRRELNFIPDQQEVQLGISSFDQLKANTPIDHDPAVNAMVRRVGLRLAEVASNALPDARWEFVVFQSKEANAFCLPGGKVGVYSGILPIAKDDAGLATVLGHEIGHAVAHHGASRMSQGLLIQAGSQALGAAISAGKYSKYQAAALAAYGAGAQLGLELPYDREQESEADHIGLVYMAEAGYDPRQAVAFWERFMQYNQQSGPSNTPVFLRDHPLDQTRIQQLRQWLPEAEAAFNKSRAGVRSP